VRSHAKASSAGSTLHRRGRIGRTLRGALASLCLATAALLALLMGPASALAVAPSIVKVTTSTVTSTTALLQADINPEGEATTYHFAYGPADCGSNPCTNAPSPDGAVGSKSNPVKVGQELKGLTPGTVYHYRLVATNGSGPSESVDRTFKTYLAPTVSACPNDVFRGGSAANLPDCRAYEMVSPIDKNGGDITTICNINCLRTALNQVSLDGEKVTYSSYKAFGDAVGSFYSNQYLATRGPDGWTTHGISPRHEGHIFPEFAPHWDLDRQFKAFTPDLSIAWLTDDAEPGLTPEAVQGDVNLYSRDNTTDTFHALTTTPPTEQVPEGGHGNKGYSMEVQGHSADGSHLIMSATAAITPDAHGTRAQLYDYSGGEFHLLSVLPDGTPATDSAYVGMASGSGYFDDRRGDFENAVSVDGSHVFWSTASCCGTKLYVRKNPGEPQSAISGGVCTEPEKACTVDVSALVPGGSGGYVDASTDGTKALSGSFYRVNVDTQAVTTITSGSYIGEVGASDDLSQVYFVSEEALAPGGVAGERNLYLWDEGATRFIAALAPADVNQGENGNISWDTAPIPFERSSRVAADGSSVAFMSESKALAEATAGYDNTDAVSGEPDSEVYVYDAEANGGAGKLLCVSCRPSGAAPVGAPRQRPSRVPDDPQPKSWAAAWLSTAEMALNYLRPLSDDGDRLFFNAYDAILPGDTNGKQDVYQWEAQGKGTCEEPGGCLSLISSGESPQNSEFVDASASGDTVVFSTNSSLLPQDPGLIDLYSATVNGGYPQPLRIAACEGETCQSAPTPPNDPTPASSAFDGPGNLKNARKPARKAHKKHAKKKQHKKKKQQSRAHRRNSTQRNG
jgi:hypothetical protein